MPQSSLFAESRRAPVAFLGENSRLGKIFLDTGCLHVEPCVSQELHRGSAECAYDTHRSFLSSQTNAAIDCLFGFTGRPLDKATGLQNNGERWYDAAVGRWMTKDPIGFLGRDANPYRYVGNSSVMYVDPSGLADDQNEWWNDCFWFNYGSWVGFRHAINYYTDFYTQQDRAKELDVRARGSDPHRILTAGDYPTELTGESQRIAAGKAESEIKQFGRDRVADAAEMAAAGAIGKVAKGLWSVEGASKVVRSERFGSFYKDAKTGLWWSKDTAGHGGSAFKVFKETGSGLEWIADADKYGDFIKGKHKGPVGLFIPFKDLFGM